jgi:hypothetical protein
VLGLATRMKAGPDIGSVEGQPLTLITLKTASEGSRFAHLLWLLRSPRTLRFMTARSTHTLASGKLAAVLSRKGDGDAQQNHDKGVSGAV